MLQSCFTARSARPIAAFLIMGSLMGFVVGQRLGHPPIVAQPPVATHSGGDRQHASGGLGTPVVHRLVQPISAQPAAHPAAPASDHGGDHNHDEGGNHAKHGGGGGDSGGGDSGGGGGD